MPNNPKNSIDQAKQAIDRIVQQNQNQRFEQDKRNLVMSINAALGPLMVPYLNAIVQNSKVNRADLQNAIQEAVGEFKSGINDALKGLKLDSIAHNIQLPEIRIPDIQIPEVVIDTQRMEDAITRGIIGLNLRIPDIKAPDIIYPDTMNVNMNRIDPRNPLPVMMMGNDGKPFNFQIPSGQGGGKSNFLTIKNLLTSGGATMVDETNTALRVSLVSGSLTLGYDTNFGPAGSNTLRVVEARDSVVSTNIQQIGGSNIAVGSGEQNSNTMRVAFATDSVASVNITGANGTLAATIVDSSGVQYSGSNPFPVSASLSASAVQVQDSQASTISSHQDSSGDFRGLDITNLRTINVVSNYNSTTSTLGGGAAFTGLAEDIKDYAVLQVSVFADQASASDGLSVQQSSDGSNWDITDVFSIPASTGKTFSFQVAARYFRIVYTNGATPQGAFRMQTVLHQTVSKNSSQRPSDGLSNENDFEQVSAYLAAFNGSTFDRLRNSSGEGNALRVQMATDAVASTNLTNQAQGSGEANSNSLRVIQATDGINSTQAKYIARTTNPSGASDGASNFGSSDKVGRALSRPVQVRELLTTAYASLSTGTEATLATAGAGTYLDLIYIMLSNQSTAAVQVDIRAVSGGNIVKTYQVPGNGTVGESLSVPWPQDATGNAWTADLPDITGTTVNVSAMFTKEV